MGKRTHSPSSHWSSETVKKTSAELYAQEWKREWGSEDAIGFVKEINSIRALRGKHVAEARVWASSLGLRADDIRKACLSFPSKTAIGLDQHVFTDIASLPDNALDSLGEIIRQCFVKLAIPTQSLLQLLVLMAKKRREQKHRHLAHNVPSHHALGISTHQSMGCRSRVIRRSEHMSRWRQESS